MVRRSPASGGGGVAPDGTRGPRRRAVGTRRAGTAGDERPSPRGGPAVKGSVPRRSTVKRPARPRRGTVADGSASRRSRASGPAQRPDPMPPPNGSSDATPTTTRDPSASRESDPGDAASASTHAPASPRVVRTTGTPSSPADAPVLLRPTV